MAGNRLIATRLSEEQARSNRRHRRREARRRGVTISKHALQREGWSLLVTNIQGSEVDTQTLCQLYALRWSIEIQFRAMKQACRLHQSLKHKRDPFHIEALVLAAMIFQLLTVDLYAKIQRRLCRTATVSGEKLFDAYANHLLTLPPTKDLLSFTADPRHIIQDKRKRPTFWDSLVQCLG